MADATLPDADVLGVVTVVVVALLVAGYALLVARQLLVLVWLFGYGLLLWLLYRFVVAVERIADAQQRRAEYERPETVD